MPRKGFLLPFLAGISYTSEGSPRGSSSLACRRQAACKSDVWLDSFQNYPVSLESSPPPPSPLRLPLLNAAGTWGRRGVGRGVGVSPPAGLAVAPQKGLGASCLGLASVARPLLALPRGSASPRQPGSIALMGNCFGPAPRRELLLLRQDSSSSSAGLASPPRPPPPAVPGLKWSRSARHSSSCSAEAGGSTWSEKRNVRSGGGEGAGGGERGRSITPPRTLSHGLARSCRVVPGRPAGRHHLAHPGCLQESPPGRDRTCRRRAQPPPAPGFGEGGRESKGRKRGT